MLTTSYPPEKDKNIKMTLIEAEVGETLLIGDDISLDILKSKENKVRLVHWGVQILYGYTKPGSNKIGNLEKIFNILELEKICRRVKEKEILKKLFTEIQEGK